MKNLEKEEELNVPKVLAIFSAQWCHGCQSLKEQIKDIECLIIDVEKFQELAVKYDIMSLPNLVLFKDGIPTEQKIGSISKNDVLKMLA